MLKDKIHIIIAQALEELNLPSDKLAISPPNNENFGDYATNIALQLAKSEKKNPMVLAQHIVDAIKTGDVIEKAEVMNPGFINIHIGKNKLIENLSQIAINKIEIPQVNSGKKIIVEYSNPNIAKPFTVGHLRSTIIGDTIANLFESTGATIYRDNHLGDWGTQFGKLIYAIKEWGNEEEIKGAENPVKILVELYVKFHTEAEKNPDLEIEGRKWFKKLEDGDEEVRRLWKQSIEWSWTEFDRLYKQLGIKTEDFENNGRGYGESYFEDKMDPIIKELKDKKILQESKGAWLVFFPDEKFPPMMLVKQDGATLYATRDLATDKFRLNKYGKDVIIINEVGAEQSLYFQQLYEVEKMAGWVTDGQRIHIKHGMFRFKDSKMSTRKGNTIWLEDVLEEAIKRAHEIAMEVGIKEQGDISMIKSSHIIGGESKREEVTYKIAIGALKWNDLKRSAHMDIVFDWDELLNMQGNSGPYVQYTYVRCKSVLGKADNPVIPDPDRESREINEEELSLIRSLSKYPETILESTQNFAPNYLCLYLYDLSQKYNLFYQKHKILKAEDDEIIQMRLTITKAVANVLSHGLTLLGIETVEKM
ncbi:MAG: arginine--tRNA ligase [bacterium]|nr:arginine--tRNA ligase [bacterium]